MTQTRRKFDEDFGRGVGADRAGEREADRAGGPGPGVNEGTLGNWCARDRRVREGEDGALTESEGAELNRVACGQP